jgi:alpha-ribazole phosphatase
MIIYLIRHARPRGFEGICYGRHDVSVDASESERAARELRQRIPKGILQSAPLYSSPLERCAQLARALANSRPIVLTPALLELDFGAWQGCRWDAVPREELDAWAADLWRYAPGHGESAEAATYRWRKWVDGLDRQSLDAVIAVTHAGLIRVAHAAASSSDPALLTMDVDYGSVYPIDVGTSRGSARALKQAQP